jgi:cell division protein FtsB
VRLRSQDFRLRALSLVAALPVLAYLLLSAAGKGYDYYRIRQEQASIRAEIERLKDQNVALRQRLDYLRTDEYVEYAARTEIGLAKPGDRIVVPVAAPGARPPAEMVAAKDAPHAPPTC